MDVGTAVAVADVVGIVDLDEKVAGLGSYLEQAILKVALFRGASAEVVPEMRHRSPRTRHLHVMGDPARIELMFH